MSITVGKTVKAPAQPPVKRTVSSAKESYESLQAKIKTFIDTAKSVKSEIDEAKRGDHFAMSNSPYFYIYSYYFIGIYRATTPISELEKLSKEERVLLEQKRRAAQEAIDAISITFEV